MFKSFYILLLQYERHSLRVRVGGGSESSSHYPRTVRVGGCLSTIDIDGTGTSIQLKIVMIVILVVLLRSKDYKLKVLEVQ